MAMRMMEVDDFIYPVNVNHLFGGREERSKGAKGAKGAKGLKRQKAIRLLHGSRRLPLNDLSIDYDSDMDLKLQTTNSILVRTKEAGGHPLRLIG